MVIKYFDENIWEARVSYDYKVMEEGKETRLCKFVENLLPEQQF